MTTWAQDVAFGLVMLTIGAVVGVIGALAVIDADIQRARARRRPDEGSGFSL